METSPSAVRSVKLTPKISDYGNELRQRLLANESYNSISFCGAREYFLLKTNCCQFDRIPSRKLTWNCSRFEYFGKTNNNLVESAIQRCSISHQWVIRKTNTRMLIKNDRWLAESDDRALQHSKLQHYLLCVVHLYEKCVMISWFMRNNRISSRFCFSVFSTLWIFFFVPIHLWNKTQFSFDA